ncbi:MAG TPA: VWA domain-containing protein, partial [Bryobacteraceae bacterium]|nr:VWA domain-containing protein [Bryobacteraceae bacterium]
SVLFLLAAAAIGGFAGDPPPGPSPTDTARQIGLSPLTVTTPATSGSAAGNSSSSARVSIVPVAPPEPAAPEAAGPRAVIRSDVDVVLVPVTVTDPMNHFVTGLDQDAFEVYEDKVKQQIVSFGSEDAPLSVGIVFDTSASMGAKLERSRLSVAEFFKTANPEDEAFLVEFNDRPQLVVPMTHNLEEIQNRLTFTQSKGRTALLDGVYLALQTMKKARNPRKALIVISDGGDNSSRYTATEVRNLVREADVQIYGIGIYEQGAARGRTPEELSGPEMLRDLAEPTGGRHFVVDRLEDLPDVAAKIGIELRNQYVVGYSPSNEARDGKYRKILVKINQPRGLPTLHAYWRTGRFAPTN